ncbi:MAG: S9 family peptidase [Prevotellaceae bacterium]|nr:S9 family peptidase [Prevotellaceae bacterium]
MENQDIGPCIAGPAWRVSHWLTDKVVFTNAENKWFTIDNKTGTLGTLEESLSDDGKITVDMVDGDIYLNHYNKQRERLTHTPEEEKNPTLSPDSQYVAFTRNNDLYTIRLADKKETRLTTDGSDVILNGYASWVYMEEILGRGSRYRAFWWSPNSEYLAFFRTDDSRVPLFTITDSPGQDGYVETIRYPKAGEPTPQVQTGIVQAGGGAVVWAKPENGDNDYFGLPYWRPDSKALWLQKLNHGQNHLQLLEMDPAAGALREIYAEIQPTWIAIDDEPRIRFLKSGKGFVLQSDKSGWNHLYLYNIDGKLLNQITAGSYTVLEVLRVDEQEKTVYFTCYKDHVGCVDFYKVGLNGKNLQRLSFGNYTHHISLSPDGRHFVTTYSDVKTPPKVALYTTNGRLIKELQDTKDEDFKNCQHPETSFVVLRSDDGLFDLPVRVTWPLNREGGKKYPVILSIYGGPNAMSVREGWRNTNDETLRLARDGVIQAVIDHRGSGHNGKTGQNYMHRNLGYWEIKDYRQAVKWLVEHGQADPEKIMITGFSYGGYLTCYAMTYGAGVFTHGVAGGSVTDWLLYDAVYTERFMDTPAENPEGYKAASVLTHAGKLEGRLLLTHGLRDENVHAQNTFQLVSLLEDLNRAFDLMIYPESRHGYRGAKRKHSQQAALRFIYEKLIP